MATDQPIFSVQQPIVKGQLTPEQQRAIHTVGGRLLLSASAGSGKTSVLTRRVIERLKAHVPIQEMLIVTFTNAAAAEMRKRIGEELNKACRSEADPTLRRHLSRQLLALPQARICTMDAFYGEFVRRNFQKLSVSPDFRVILGPEHDLLRRSTLQSVFDTLYEEGDEVFLACVDAFSGERDDVGFFEQMLELIDKLDSEPYPMAKMDELYEMFRQQDMARSPWYLYHKKTVEDSLRELRPVFVQAADEATAHREELGDAIVGQRLADVSVIDGALALLGSGNIPPKLAFDKLSPLNAKYRNYAVYRPIHAKAKAARGRVAALYEKLHIPSADEFAAEQKLSALLVDGMRRVVTRYERADRAAKRRKNVLSFADASRLTLSLLVEQYEPSTDTVTLTEFARSYIDGHLGGRIQEVLIDEYQDTNLLQNLIFRALSDNGKNLFCVGDLKQSIYRFRKARPDLFAGELQRFSPQEGQFPQVQFLTRNFRSSRGVLGFVNFFFSFFQYFSFIHFS